MHRCLSLHLTLLVLLLGVGPAQELLAQRVNPLVYDDPVYGWQDNRDPEAPRPSPNAITGLQIGSTRVMVAYGSPGVKGRKVFGGLVPYGRVWRTGANEATTIMFTDDVLVAGHAVPAGTYSLFTIPGPSAWTVILNREHNLWGAYDYRPAADLLRFEVTPEQAPPRERLAFVFEEIDPEAFTARLVLHWDTVRVGFSIAEP